MKSTLPVLVMRLWYLPLLLVQWPLLIVANAETIVGNTPDVDQPIPFDIRDVVHLEEESEGMIVDGSQDRLVPMDRSLQWMQQPHLGNCIATSTWTNKIVMEVAYAPECFLGVLGNQDVAVNNAQMSSFVSYIQTVYKNLYNRMNGNVLNLGVLCDPFARLISTASVQRITRRMNSNVLAVELLVTSTCRGCSNPGAMKLFDLPTNSPSTTQIASLTCSCATPGTRLRRGVFEYEFYTSLQQLVDNNTDNCIKTSAACSHGTPFEANWEFDLDVYGTLTESAKNDAAAAFIRASNRMYTATTSHCQPEYRRIERTSNFDPRRRLDTEDNHNGQNPEGSDRKLRRQNVAMRLSTKGTCTACSGRAHTGTTSSSFRIPRRRELQATRVDTSNCFCPPGSTVAATPPHIDSLVDFFKLEIGDHPVVKGIVNLREVQKRRRLAHHRQLQSESLTPPMNTQRSLQVLPDPPSTCAMVRMNFTNIVNPMARFYGQPNGYVLKGGDYLFDQLWWTHGIKVSARIKNPSHVWDNNIWIPRFQRGTGWIDSKPQHVITDYTTGGAMRLFDTLRPAYNSNSAWNQPLCANAWGEGDTDLGSPNWACPGGGPGSSWHGQPTSAYPNCVPQGLAIIIQEGNRACPDDTVLGGIITIEFRQPVEFVKAMTFLNNKFNPTPDVKVVYNGNKEIMIDTVNSGGNSVYQLPFETDTIRNVQRIEVTTGMFGTISSLEYPYCPRTPIPKIAIKKYGGPTSGCTASNVWNLGDVEYTVPSNANWAYCYVISIPSDSDECVYDVILKDTAPGGIGTRSVTQVHERLCRGDVRYIVGPTRSFWQAPESSVTATVEGFGMSGTRVTSQDGVTIKR